MENSQTASTLVVRNIGDIESALAHAHKIGEGLWQAVEAELRAHLKPHGWHVCDFEENDARIRFAPREWLVGDDALDPWFSIEPFAGPSGEFDETYLAEFLQAGPEGAGIAVWFASNAMDKKRYRQRLTSQQDGDLATLRTAGWAIDDQNWIHFSVKLNADAVAQGAEDEDYRGALGPLRAAVDEAVANVGRFAALVHSSTVADAA